MWAGLPVVTAPGEVHVSRVAAALAMSEGAQPLVARSLEDYLSLVVALLRAPGKLRRLKQSIRGRLAAPSQPPLVSPLWDVTYFADLCLLEERENLFFIRLEMDTRNKNSAVVSLCFFSLSLGFF